MLIKIYSNSFIKFRYEFILRYTDFASFFRSVEVWCNEQTELDKFK